MFLWFVKRGRNTFFKLVTDPGGLKVCITTVLFATSFTEQCQEHLSIQFQTTLHVYEIVSLIYRIALDTRLEDIGTKKGNN